AAGLLERAKASMNKGQAEFDFFKTLPKPPEAAESLKEVEDSYAAPFQRVLHLLHLGLVGRHVGLFQRRDQRRQTLLDQRRV
ncbi:chemotaxis protein, partial [Xylella fastidiosa subsp. multiplex]|nr:chemotaxis protein [Xylella fastidiosa subsp. multiplex]